MWRKSEIFLSMMKFSIIIKIWKSFRQNVTLLQQKITEFVKFFWKFVKNLNGKYNFYTIFITIPENVASSIAFGNSIIYLQQSSPFVENGPFVLLGGVFGNIKRINVIINFHVNFSNAIKLYNTLKQFQGPVL